MDDDKLAKEYIEFVKSVNSDWSISDEYCGNENRNMLIDAYGYIPRKRKKRRKSAIKSGERRCRE